MSFRLSHLVTAFSSAALLLSAPTWACRGACECGHSSHGLKGAAQAKAPMRKGDGLAAACNCQGPSDCTCKKGQCTCKKCPKHHRATEVQKTQLLAPLNGSPAAMELPTGVPLEASPGVVV